MSTYSTYQVRFTTDTGDGGTVSISSIDTDWIVDGAYREYNVKYGRSLYGQPHPLVGGTGTVVKVELLTRTTFDTSDVIEP